jgi:thiol-disulfide isomerase/thioredoxin
MLRTALPFLTALLLGLSGCSEKAGEQTGEQKHVPEENLTQSEEIAFQPRTFTLRDIDDRELNLSIEGNSAWSIDIDQPLVLINLFATWCPPCRGELPDLSKLQRAHAKDLFIIGILVNDEQNKTQLRRFMEKHGANYFISYSETNDKVAAALTESLELPENFPLPLSILYKDGELVRYYEGAMPIEMMEWELAQATKQHENKD